MGWASIERNGSTPVYHMSGIIPIPKPDPQPFQDYRLELEATLTYWIPTLFDLTQPDRVVSETVPAVGSFNGVQMYVVNVAITVVHTIAMQRGLPVSQIGATTVHKRIVGKRKKGQKVTKVQVRNGVIKLLPELESRKRDWVKVFEEPDAIATGLAELGFENGS